MTSIVHSSVEIQLSAEPKAVVPSWFEEVVVMSAYLKEHHLLASLAERVRFSRARMGRFDLIDFVAVLLGYALSGERSLHDFYQRLADYGELFMALFERDQLPHRSTLSRFLAAVSPACVELLRQEVLADLGARRVPQQEEAGWWDRTGQQWLLFDVDGTRAVARQRALPQASHLPPAHRRVAQVCAPGYRGRKRGEVVRTRTTVLHGATNHWIATFSGSGNGDLNAELVRALQAITTAAQMRGFATTSVIVRLDGLYGTGAFVARFQEAKLAFVGRGKEYGVLKDAAIQARLALPADAAFTSADSGMQRQLYDCASVRLPAGPRCRVIIASHAATTTPPTVGVIREGVVYELFYTSLPQEGFLASDVLAMYLHRGAFETVLADEDQEQEPDRWCSQTPCGQEFWQILSQWVWNLRLEMGQLSHPTPLRTTIFAAAVEPSPLPPSEGVAPAGQSDDPLVRLEPPPSHPEVCEPLASHELAPLLETTASPHWSRAARPGLFAGADFTLQDNGTLRCPAGHTLTVRERRQESEGTLRLYYMASAHSCGPCSCRQQCLRNGEAARSPRKVSVLQRAESPPLAPPKLPSPAPPLAAPLPAGSQPLLLKDGERCETRRGWMRLMRTYQVEIEALAASPAGEVEPETVTAVLLTRAQRAHWRMTWQERLARNAAPAQPPRWTLRLHGLPSVLAAIVHPSR